MKTCYFLVLIITYISYINNEIKNSLCEDGYFRLGDDTCGICPIGTYSDQSTKIKSPFCQLCKSNEESIRYLDIVKEQDYLNIECKVNDKIDCKKEVDIKNISKSKIMNRMNIKEISIVEIIMRFSFNIHRISENSYLMLNYNSEIYNNNSSIGIYMNSTDISSYEFNNDKYHFKKIGFYSLLINITLTDDSFIKFNSFIIKNSDSGPYFCFQCTSPNSIVLNHICEECSFGTRPNMLFNKCLVCEYNDNTNKCEFCPSFTVGVNGRCQLNNIVHIKKQGMLFYFPKYEIDSSIKILSRDNINTEYFISPFKPSQFCSNEFNYIAQKDKNEGYIKKISTYENRKEIYNIGEYIKEVKVLPYMNILNKKNPELSINNLSGLIIKYTNTYEGEDIDHDSMVFLFLICSNFKDFHIFEIESPSKSKYFIWKNQIGCSLCNKQIINDYINESVCINHKQFYTYYKPDFCRIESETELEKILSNLKKETKLNPHIKVVEDKTLEYNEDLLLLTKDEIMKNSEYRVFFKEYFDDKTGLLFDGVSFEFNYMNNDMRNKSDTNEDEYVSNKIYSKECGLNHTSNTENIIIYAIILLIIGNIFVIIFIYKKYSVIQSMITNKLNSIRTKILSTTEKKKDGEMVFDN